MVPLLTQLTSITKTDSDTANQTAFSYTAPSGLITPGCSLYGRFEFSTNAVVAVAKNMTLSLGGIGAGTFQMNTTSMDYRGDFQIMAIDASNAKAWWPGTFAPYGNGSTGAAYTNVARDFTTALSLVGTINWATAGSGTNTLTFRPFKLWLIP